MKKFTEPTIEILHLNISDIITASNELIGWAGFSDFNFLSDDKDTNDQLSD